ncbi:MAG TPA: S-layer homology domain-containing protein, partial [Trueperaceae bacterium]|nr:S-layer homology domain-containing protein [Trueperaceae bacterium]
MKKLIITLLAAITASGAFAQYSFPDIPANHWAGDAVDRISSLGIVIGFPDGTFRGNEAFTRYQAALVVSRLLDVINDNLNSALALTQADVDSLRNAVQELASDVAAQGVRLSAAESAIAGLSDDVTA